MSGLKIAVTGASGNLGSALLCVLADRGHDTVGICRRPPQGGTPYERTEWVSLDLSSPDVGPPLLDAFAGVDAVVHLAWAIQPARDPAKMERVNVGGSRSVLDAAAAAQVDQLVHVSSSAVYAPTRGPVDESWRSSRVCRSKPAEAWRLPSLGGSGGLEVPTRVPGRKSLAGVGRRQCPRPGPEVLP